MFPDLCLAQAPVISYPSPKTYIIDKPVTPLVPNNAGGTVSPESYGLVTLFAGQTGVKGASGGVLGQSQFITPLTICTSPSGNIFVNDPANKAIKEISPGGDVVFRSQGVPINAGSPMALNNFDNPTGIAADAADNVYIADTYNNVIRKVAPDQVITIYAGNRLPASVDGTGANASFNQPTEMTADAQGNLYVVDGGYAYNKLRKISPGGIVTTLFNLTNTGKIGGIVRDKNGNFFVTKPTENTIEKISPAGLVTIFAGTGVAGSMDGSITFATFNNPGGIAIDGEGNLYTVSATDNLVRKITVGGVVSVFAGKKIAGSADGVGTAASFNAPTGIAFDTSGNGYIADNGNSTIRRMSITGYEIDKVLPTGLFFDNTTGIITGTPTVLWPSTDYTITAHNFYGNGITTVSIQVVASGLLTFPPIADVFTCSADFYIGATSSNSISYSTSNAGVAIIIGEKIHITGAGTVSIIASDGINSITRNFNVTILPQPAIAIASSANPACIGSKVTFTASATNAGNTPAYNWQLNGISTGIVTNTYTSILSDGSSVSCILIPSNGCNTPVTSNNITQQIDDLPVVSFTSSSISVAHGKSIQLNPTVEGNVQSYQWLPADGLDNPAIPNPIASPASPTAYKILITTKGGCTAEATINIDVFTQITVHNAFSPNGDGVNDTWNMPDLAYFPGCTVKIFNRYGNLIFNSVNYSKPWDGTFNGTNLPPGTYYYIINPNNSTPVMSGQVTLIR